MAPKNNKAKKGSKKPKVAGGAARSIAKTSSSYTSSGIASPPALDSELGSSFATRPPELVPELVSAYSRLLTYAKMMNDAGVDVSMRAAKTPVLGADVFMQPYSSDQLDLDVNEFIESNLFEGMSSPILNSFEDILHMYEDGYACLEKVYENRMWTPKRAGGNGKQYTMLKKLSVRPPSTITGIEYDNNGGPLKITQNAVQADKSVAQKEIDISKLLIFTFNRNGGDLTGKSLLRTAYPHWYYKTHFYKIDAIQKERHSLGVPKGKLMPGYTAADKKILRQLLANLRSNEESFMVLPPNVDVEFAEMHGNLVNVLESADHHNIQILMNVMVQFLALGVESSGGGRATGGAQTDIFMKALRYVANYIVDVINMYLIPELVVWNFPTTNFPKLQVRNIGETRDLQMLGSALGNLYSQGVITTDRNTEQWARKTFDMPMKHDDDPALDPNARQKAVVTLYDADGTPVDVPAHVVNTVQDAAASNADNTPVAPSANGGAANGNGNGKKQKGGVKASGGQPGKPPTAAE